jgi:hypothetical protein
VELLGQLGRALLPLLFLGCTQTIHLAESPRIRYRETIEKRWQSHYFLGFIGRSSLDLRDVCSGHTVSKIALTHNYATVALWIVTAGIYTPRRIILTCETESPPP